MAGKHILLIDDDVGMRAVLQDILEDEGYEVKTASDGRGALSAIEKDNFDLILTDLKMPKMNGMEFLDYIEQNRPDLKVVVITAYTGKSTHAGQPVNRSSLSRNTVKGNPYPPGYALVTS